MMPPTATLEDIKAHQRKVEKDKITPDNLSPCPRCSVGSEFFKIHAYRERRFLIIIEMLIKASTAAWFDLDVPVAARHSPSTRILLSLTNIIRGRPSRDFLPVTSNRKT